MNFFNEWGIPLLVLIVWIVLTLAAIPPIMNRLKRKAEQSEHNFNAILLSALGTPLVLFLLGIGLNLFIDMMPALPAKWEKYFDALLLIVFVLAGYLFLDRLMMRVIRRYSKTVDAIASAAGVMKTLYRTAVLTFAAFIILDRLKITITPFLASLGIGGLVVALALQDTLSNFFSGIYLFFDKPVRIGDYVKLESGEEGYINFYLPEREVAVFVNLSVIYESDLDQVEKATIEVAREVLHETEGGIREFDPFIRYNSFGDSGINFTVILRANDYADQYVIIHEFIKRLHRRYKMEGIETVSSVRNAYLRKLVSEIENRE